MAIQAYQPPEPLRRVIVTGGAGYIGSHVVHCLQKTRRYKVVVIDNFHNSYPAALDRVAKIARDALPLDPSPQDKDSAEIDVVEGDLVDANVVRALFRRYGQGGIWGVIHIAAWKAVGESSQVPLTYYNNNVSATLQLLQIMGEFDCNRIVYSSSATVYGIPPVIPIPETSALQANSPYGKTKVMCEMIIEDLCQSDPKWSALSLRYFNPGGAHPSGIIGEEPRGRPQNLLPILSHMANGRIKESVLKVFGNDYPTVDGTCVRDYLHVLDLASGHVLALDALSPESNVFDNKDDGVRYKAYNLGKGQGMSVLQIVEAMRKATGFNYKYEVIGRRRGDVPDLTANPSLAEKELGFKAVHDLETMCRDLWNWQTKNPDGWDTPVEGWDTPVASPIKTKANGHPAPNGLNGVARAHRQSLSHATNGHRQTASFGKNGDINGHRHTISNGPINGELNGHRYSLSHGHIILSSNSLYGRDASPIGHDGAINGLAAKLNGFQFLDTNVNGHLSGGDVNGLVTPV